ncbi:DUF6702 family protein [Jiulongibacter sp. NS-SX5]|uniref:DUF6702 family protein n=1 Tax=Jiulongibacter sp. NS-SX5 TaxID=3463854 RepID=UPI0040597BC3
MRNIFALTGLALVLFCFTSKHDFHTSLAEVRLNAKANTYEVSIRVFSDDLESAMQKHTGDESLRLGNPKLDKALGDYLKRHFAFVKEKEVEFGYYIGKEIELDVTWLYIEFDGAQGLREFKLLNTIFFELFDDQTNVVNYISKDERHTLLYSLKDKLHPNPL